MFYVRLLPAHRLQLVGEFIIKITLAFELFTVFMATRSNLCPPEFVIPVWHVGEHINTSPEPDYLHLQAQPSR